MKKERYWHLHHPHVCHGDQWEPAGQVPHHLRYGCHLATLQLCGWPEDESNVALLKRSRCIGLWLIQGDICSLFFQYRSEGFRPDLFFHEKDRPRQACYSLRVHMCCCQQGDQHICQDVVHQRLPGEVRGGPVSDVMSDLEKDVMKTLSRVFLHAQMCTMFKMKIHNIFKCIVQ